MTQSVRELVAHTLRPFCRSIQNRNDYGLSLQLFDEARAVGTEALIGAGVGLDLFSGERILAAAQLLERPKGHEHRVSLAITDRRTALSGWSSIVGPAARDRQRFSVLLAEITAAQSKKAGFIESAHIALSTGHATHKVVFAELQPQLGAFFMQLAQAIPPPQRCELPTPAMVVSESDPTGSGTALAGLWFDDPKAREMLAQVDAATREGMPEEIARDLVGRIVLAHRAIAGTPCMREGLWLSPLTAQDLGHTLFRIFGPPTQQVQPQAGVDQLTFGLDPQRDVLGTTVTALGVASYVALGVGFDPATSFVNTAFGRRAVTALSVRFQEQGGTTAYSLMAPSGSLETVDGLLSVRCHAAISAAAHSVLARRVAYGWNMPSAELLAAPEPGSV